MFFGKSVGDFFLVFRPRGCLERLAKRKWTKLNFPSEPTLNLRTAESLAGNSAWTGFVTSVRAESLTEDSATSRRSISATSWTKGDSTWIEPSLYFNFTFLTGIELSFATAMAPPESTGKNQLKGTKYLVRRLFFLYRNLLNTFLY